MGARPALLDTARPERACTFPTPLHSPPQAFEPAHPIPATRRTRTADSSVPAPWSVVRSAVHAKIVEAVILTHPVPMVFVIGSRTVVAEVEGRMEPRTATFREGNSRQPQGSYNLNRPLFDSVLIARPQQHGHHDTLEPVRVPRSGAKINVAQAVPKLSHTMGVHQSPPFSLAAICICLLQVVPTSFVRHAPWHYLNGPGSAAVVDHISRLC